MNQDKPNSAWVTAPYRVDFLLAVTRCPRKKWSRKRRLKWVRRETKRLMRSFRPPPVRDFDIKNLIGEKEIAAMTPRCGACEGDITEPHVCYYCLKAECECSESDASPNLGDQ